MSLYGNCSPQGLGPELKNSDHAGFGISSINELTLGNCTTYKWNNTTYTFNEQTSETFGECRDRLAYSSDLGKDSIAFFEFPKYLHQDADDALTDADCETCRRKYARDIGNLDSYAGSIPLEGGDGFGNNSIYPTNLLNDRKYYRRSRNNYGNPTTLFGAQTSAHREPFANDYTLENGSLCIRIGEHGWPGPPQIGLPETFTNPSTFLDVVDNRPNSNNALRDYENLGGYLDYKNHNMPFYGYPRFGEAGQDVGLHAGYIGQKTLTNTDNTSYSDNGAKKIASFPAWMRPVKTDVLETYNNSGGGTFISSDNGMDAIEIANSNPNIGRTEWFGSWIMPETYPSNAFYQQIDPSYNYTGQVDAPVPLGPQLVGWLCGFTSPAYKVSKDHYDATNQVWKDTYHYCLDKHTCPELFKPSIMNRRGNITNSSEPFDRGTPDDPCIEPIIPINMNTNPDQNTQGVLPTGMELDVANYGRLQTLKSYVTSDGNGNDILGMCAGGMIEHHKNISSTLHQLVSVDNSETSPTSFGFNRGGSAFDIFDYNLTDGGQTVWNGHMRSILPLMMQGTPFFGIQRPLTASQGQLGSFNGPEEFPLNKYVETNPTGGQPFLYAIYAPGNIGMGGEYRFGENYEGSQTQLYSMYDSQMNIGSNTGRNLRGIPKTGYYVTDQFGNPFSGGDNISNGACSTPEYTVNAGTNSDVTKEYYPCLCDVTQLDPNSSSYNAGQAFTDFYSVQMRTLAASSAGNPNYLKTHTRVSDPLAPAVCALKHGEIPRMVVKMYKGEHDTQDDGAITYSGLGGYETEWWNTPHQVYTHTIRNNVFLDNKFHLIDLLSVPGGGNRFGQSGNWSEVIDNAIKVAYPSGLTNPDFESCCLPDGSCSSELEYARCIDQGGTPRNVPCDVPCQDDDISTIGSCCYVDPETGRPTSSDGVTKQTCKRLKGSFSDTKTAYSRVNSKETGCCESCGGGSNRSTDINLTGGRFRSRASSSETDIRTTDITSFDKALNEELKTELQNSYNGCNLPDAYRISAERYESLIMNYEYEKDLACTNARVKGMDLNLVSYFNCKCTLLDEFVTNMKNTFKENVCQTLENQTDPMKTILAVKMEELIEVNRRFENNCLAIIESDTGAVSTFEKAKGCCCRYAKDGYQLGNSRYNENDLVGCSHISKFECDKFVNFNTKWTRCLSECRDGCSTPDNPANCTRCSDRFDGTNRVTPTPRSSTSSPSSSTSSTTTRTSQSSSSPPQSGSGY